MLADAGAGAGRQVLALARVLAETFADRVRAKEARSASISSVVLHTSILIIVDSRMLGSMVVKIELFTDAA